MCCFYSLALSQASFLARCLAVSLLATAQQICLSPSSVWDDLELRDDCPWSWKRSFLTTEDYWTILSCTTFFTSSLRFASSLSVSSFRSFRQRWHWGPSTVPYALVFFPVDLQAWSKTSQFHRFSEVISFLAYCCISSLKSLMRQTLNCAV